MAEIIEPCLSQGHHQWKARAPKDPGPLVGEPCECGLAMFTEEMVARCRLVDGSVRFHFDDIPFMPVPRCDQCRFWERNTLGDVSRGECSLTAGCDGDGNAAAHPESKARAVVGGDEFGVPVLETSEDFGCVQWERKA